MEEFKGFNSTEKIRNLFLENIEKKNLKNLFRDLPIDYIIGKERFFGDLHSQWLSEIIGLSDGKKILDLGITSLFGRAYVIAQDQILDKHNLNYEYVVKGPLLLYLFCNRLNRLVDNPGFNKEIERILALYANANIHEKIRHRDKLNPYSKEDMNDIVDKTGLIKLPVNAACYLANKIINKEKLEKAIHEIQLAIQICDDISDVEADFNQGLFTLPVTYGIYLSDKKKKGISSIYNGLFLSGLYESLLLKVKKSLSKGKTLIKSISKKETSLSFYLERLENYIDKISQDFISLKKRKGILLNKISPDFRKIEPVQKDDLEEYKDFIHYLDKLRPEKLAPKNIK